MKSRELALAREARHIDWNSTHNASSLQTVFYSGVFGNLDATLSATNPFAEPVRNGAIALRRMVVEAVIAIGPNEKSPVGRGRAVVNLACIGETEHGIIRAMELEERAAQLAER